MKLSSPSMLLTGFISIVSSLAEEQTLDSPNLRADAEHQSNQLHQIAQQALTLLQIDACCVIGIGLAAAIVFIAAGGGTGGDAVLNSVYVLVMHLNPKIAIPLTSITVVGGAFANFILNIRKPRRNSTETLIDWDFILVMQPMLLLGSNFGTFINNIAPSWLIRILLVSILIYSSRRMFGIALSARRRERWGCCGDVERTTLIGANTHQSYTAHQPRHAEPAAKQVVIPWRKVGALLGLFGGIVLLNLLAGTPSFPSIIGLSPQSFLYFIASFLPVIFLIIFSRYASKNVLSTFYRQQNPRYILSPDEIQWTPNSVQYFPLICMGAGAVAGMFNIDGGIVNAPLLLEMGVEPSAATAMTATTVLFSSAMSSLSYILLDELDWSLAKILLPLGFFATYLGHIVLTQLVKRYNCPSLFSISIAIILVMSTFGVLVDCILQIS